jgi:RNA polymerase sigma-70 factor (sigma-E family)
VQEAQDADVVERLLAERGTQLMRTAVLLAGSRQDGEDLLQAALERLIRQGRRITGDPEGYLRRTLYNLAADGWRRQQTWRRKLPVLGASTPASAPDLTAAVDLRDALIRALHQLSPQQRAAVVLRYWEQLSEAEAAEVLGCSPGTVKAAASRGLRRMRELATGEAGSAGPAGQASRTGWAENDFELTENRK